MRTTTSPIATTIAVTIPSPLFRELRLGRSLIYMLVLNTFLTSTSIKLEGGRREEIRLRKKPPSQEISVETPVIETAGRAADGSCRRLKVTHPLPEKPRGSRSPPASPGVLIRRVAHPYSGSPLHPTLLQSMSLQSTATSSGGSTPSSRTSSRFQRGPFHRGVRRIPVPRWPGRCVGYPRARRRPGHGSTPSRHG